MGIGSVAGAFVAGLLTVLSPCVLPILPIVLGAAASERKYGPAALAAGLAISFAAIGLFVAVPAVMGYNWLLARNKSLQEALRNFASDLHAYLVSGARIGSNEMGGARPAAAPAAAVRK